jgi:hypothetical protein
VRVPAAGSVRRFGLDYPRQVRSSDRHVVTPREFHS